jgi:crotonobetainyl-CoA:carnitine CoA-transferase CaiB-like acyl-CoA transferase
MMKPLEDITVLDLTHAHAGPICTLYLAALGAKVVKIEPPWGETIRFFPPLVKGVSPYFAFLDRCKKGVTLNLKKEKGKELFEELVKRADVLVENFSPGTMDRLGLGWDRLQELNPRIIYTSISGFGQTGPWKDYRSYDVIAQAASGFMWLMKDAINQEGKYHVAPEAIADTIPGFTALIGILAAVYNREKTGEGQRIDIAQLDSMIAIQQSFSFWNLAKTTFTQAVHSAGPDVYGLYEAIDGHVMLSLTTGRITDRFKELFKIEEISQTEIEKWVSQKTVEEVVEILSDNSIPVAPVNNLEEAQKNIQANSREMFVEVDDPKIGKHIQPGFPIKFSKLETDISKPAPTLGEYNEEIYEKIVGLKPEEIKDLRKNGVI